MKKIKAIVAAALFAISLSGCVSDQAYRTYVPNGTYPAKAIGDVAVLYEKPEREFQVLADLQARGDAVASFRRVAASLGGDAVIVSRLGGYAGNSTWADEPKGSSYTRIIGSVIKYK
jgi:hypothetical protein